MSLEQTVIRKVDFISSELVGLIRALIRVSSENPPGDDRGISQVVSDKLSSIDVGIELVTMKPERVNTFGAMAGSSGGRNLLLNGLSMVFGLGNIYQSGKHVLDEWVSVSQLLDFAKIYALMAMDAYGIDDRV